jgi:glycosyltransferase involved in cell wall biosynthesis
MGTEATAGQDARSRRVVLVELNAHREFGHFPVVFAELATELLDLGCAVQTLTRRGWSLDSDPGFPPLDIHRYGRLEEGATRWSERLQHLWPHRVGDRLRRIAMSALITATARRLRKRINATDVVVVTHVPEPLVAAVVAGAGRWLLYQYDGPVPTLTPRGASTSVWWRIARRSELRRQQRGGRMRIAASTSGRQREWAEAVPWFDPVAIPFIAVRPRDTIEHARSRLGLPEHRSLSLLFGAHPLKDLECVWRAFAEMPERTLVIAGGLADEEYRAWSAANPHAHLDAIVFDGFVDEATRELLYAAVDHVIVSYKADVESDSGNVMDAIAAGRPVICSDRCSAARVVRDHALGVTFEPSNPRSLVEVVRNAPTAIDAERLREAREEFSGRRVAQRNLEALEG